MERDELNGSKTDCSVRLDPHEATAVAAILRRVLPGEADYRIKRDAGDALARIERGE